MTNKKQSSPLVSIIIPVFNGALYLEEAVASIQKNTYRNIEILLVNDGSTDKSKHLCEALTKRYRNVRFFDFPRNRGLGRVLNFALEKAKGNLICRLNQDDRMLPIRIATQVAFLQKHPEVLVVGSCIKLFDNTGKVQMVKFLEQDLDIKKFWYIVSPFSDPSVMYRKDEAINVGGYCQEFWPADDTHLWYRMGMKGKLANIQKPLVEVRWHDAAASVKHFRKLALRTYQMHEWTHEYVASASLLIQLYWIIQLIAGYTLSPHINWAVYRVIKKAIAYYKTLKIDFTRIRKNILVPKVASHPKKLNISGV
jgi:glycosyltransferase involved in cell wall biosynthesis